MNGIGKKRLIPGGAVKYIWQTNYKKLEKKSAQLLFGLHPVAEAINSGKEINKILIRKGLKGELFTEVFQKIRDTGIPYQLVPAEKLNRMTHGNHQGIIALLSLIEYKNLEEIVQRAFEEGRDPFILVLDRITDVRNFGAITRTAECAGVDAVVIPEKESAAISPDAMKTSAGALNQVAVSRRKDLVQTVKYLKESGLNIIAATEKADDYYYTSDVTGPVAILLGSEDTGISPVLLKLADKQVRIPLEGAIQSLNVSVACGIIVFEVLRQRRLGSKK
jgi:23S rRNA (guanosine2251-2'-O)-methyltransferase